jgi:hypothetical protein
LPHYDVIALHLPRIFCTLGREPRRCSRSW